MFANVFGDVQQKLAHPNVIGRGWTADRNSIRSHVRFLRRATKRVRPNGIGRGWTADRNSIRSHVCFFLRRATKRVRPNGIGRALDCRSKFHEIRRLPLFCDLQPLRTDTDPSTSPSLRLSTEHITAVRPGLKTTTEMVVDRSSGWYVLSVLADRERRARSQLWS
jgi:hypothetical protein